MKTDNFPVNAKTLLCSNESEWESKKKNTSNNVKPCNVQKIDGSLKWSEKPVKNCKELQCKHSYMVASKQIRNKLLLFGWLLKKHKTLEETMLYMFMEILVINFKNNDEIIRPIIYILNQSGPYSFEQGLFKWPSRILRNLVKRPWGLKSQKVFSSLNLRANIRNFHANNDA